MRAMKAVMDTILGWIAIIFFAALVLVVVWQVASREILGNPSTWSEEAARQTFVWVGLIAAAYVFGERGHIAVEYVMRKFPAGMQRWVAVFVQLVVLAFATIVLIWGGWRASQGAWGQNLSALPFTVGHMYLALPISGVLISLYALYFIVELLRRKQPAYPEIETDEVETRES